MMAEPMGFFTDTTVCIGCKACEVACKEWNQLPATDGGANTLSGDSYDNTRRLDGQLAARQVHRAVQPGPHGRALADDERRLQALRPGRLPGGLPDRRDHPHRVRHGGDPVRRLQRLPRLHRRLPVRRHRHEPGRRARRRSAPSATTGCRAASSRPAPRPARPTRSSSGPIADLRQRRGSASGSCTGGRDARLPLRRRRQDAGRPQRLLPARGQARGVRPAARPEAAHAQPGAELAVLGAGRAGDRADGPRQLPHAGRQRQRPGRRRRDETTGCHDTFFTAPPEWRWLVICYFFVGGIAGGCYMLAVLADLFGDARRSPARAVGLRHRVRRYRGERAAPHPRSGAATALLAHAAAVADLPADVQAVVADVGGVVGSVALRRVLLAFVAGCAGRRRPRALAMAGRLRPTRALGKVFAVVGGLLGFFVAGYTGVLLSVTNRPIWADTWLLGLAFLVSAASISAALLVLIAHARGWWTSASSRCGGWSRGCCCWSSSS